MEFCLHTRLCSDVLFNMDANRNIKISKFQKMVYRVVAEIPRGQTITYKEVAVAIGKPLACRAVGNALNKNYNKSVPCHRVVRSNGQPGGFNRGSDAKIKLLTREGAILE